MFATVYVRGSKIDLTSPSFFLSDSGVSQFPSLDNFLKLLPASCCVECLLHRGYSCRVSSVPKPGQAFAYDRLCDVHYCLQ